MLKLAVLTTLLHIIVFRYVQVEAQTNFLAAKNEPLQQTSSNQNLEAPDLMDFEVGFNERETELEFENEHGSNWENEENFWGQQEELNLEALVTKGDPVPSANESEIIPNEEYFLPPATPLPGREGEPVYTLVLDMDETLLHYQIVY